VDSLLLAERMFLVSIVPNVAQMSHVLTEKFNIGGKSGAPFYFTHDEQARHFSADSRHVNAILTPF